MCRFRSLHNVTIFPTPYIFSSTFFLDWLTFFAAFFDTTTPNLLALFMLEDGVGISQRVIIARQSPAIKCLEIGFVSHLLVV